MTATPAIIHRARAVVRAIGRGFFNLTHNSFALLGIAVVFVIVGLVAQPDLREIGESRLMSWLHERKSEAMGMDLDMDALGRATAVDPRELPKQQAALAFWISKKYRVAPEPISALVAEAYDAAGGGGLEPTLILAVMAIESGFNPFAQSSVGAQGLMQVMTSVHTEKYDGFGGRFAAFDPVTNLRVGTRVLRDCIARAGSVEGGLRLYVGAANIDDGGYAQKVLAEQTRLHQVAQGRKVAFNSPQAAPAETQKPVRLSYKPPITDPSVETQVAAAADDEVRAPLLP